MRDENHDLPEEVRVSRAPPCGNHGEQEHVGGWGPEAHWGEGSEELRMVSLGWTHGTG